MPTGKFIGPCIQCKSEVWLPQELYDAAMRGRSRITFYCGYGHPQVFTEGETTEDILRRERDRLKQQMAQRDDVISKQSRELFAERELVNSLKAQRKAATKRAKAGVCPCCHRTIRQMALHMRTQHPEFTATEVH